MFSLPSNAQVKVTTETGLGLLKELRMILLACNILGGKYQVSFMLITPALSGINDELI